MPEADKPKRRRRYTSRPKHKFRDPMADDLISAIKNPPVRCKIMLLGGWGRLPVPGSSEPVTRPLRVMECGTEGGMGVLKLWPIPPQSDDPIIPKVDEYERFYSKPYRGPTAVYNAYMKKRREDIKAGRPASRYVRSYVPGSNGEMPEHADDDDPRRFPTANDSPNGSNIGDDHGDNDHRDDDQDGDDQDDDYDDFRLNYEPIDDEDIHQDAYDDDMISDDMEEDLGDGEGDDQDDDGSTADEQAPVPIFDPAALGLKEINNLAHFGVSSHKPGNGVEELLSDDLDKYWQSDGQQPHLLTIHFLRRVEIRAIRFYVDYNQDESYTPTHIVFHAGTGQHDLAQFAEMPLANPVGWQDVPLDDCGGGADGNSLCCWIVQMHVKENHQNGKDTHIRGIKIYGPDEYAVNGGISTAVREMETNIDEAANRLRRQALGDEEDGFQDLLDTLDQAEDAARYRPGAGGFSSIPDFMRDQELR